MTYTRRFIWAVLAMALASGAAAQLPTASVGIGQAGGRVVWPPVVEVDSRTIEVKALEANPGKYIYQSKTFQFTSEDKLAGSVMKEVARTFEATRALMEALPWKVRPTPPEDTGFFRAQFYVTRESYIAAGGPGNSGGVYTTKDRTFRVPFPSLGLEMRGKTWFKNSDFREDTIVHEITHQMMHDYIPFLPIWVTEGTAEYARMLPFKAGRFLSGSHERGIKEYIKNAQAQGINPAQLVNLAEHMKLTSANWHQAADRSPQEQHRLYFTSCLLVYYFCHLDGEDGARRFVNYLGQINDAQKSWQGFFKDPRVKVQSDGSYQYPSDLPTPAQARSEEFGIGQVSILMNGRTPEQMQTAIRDAYKKIGVRW